LEEKKYRKPFCASIEDSRDYGEEEEVQKCGILR
jgi:hypothetical protein